MKNNIIGFSILIGLFILICIFAYYEMNIAALILAGIEFILIPIGLLIYGSIKSKENEN